MPFLASDRRRLDAFRRGEAWALTEVYRHYAPFVFTRMRDGFAIGQKGQSGYFPGLRDVSTRENLAQEVFARAFGERARERYDGLRPYQNYLGAILRNLVIDELRRHREFVEWEESGVPSEAPAAGLEPPDVPLDRQELRAAVNGFEETLGDRDRRVLNLRFRQGLSLQAVVKETGLTDYRVKKIEKRIRKRFLKHMRACGFLGGSDPNQAAFALAWAVLLLGDAAP